MNPMPSLTRAPRSRTVRVVAGAAAAVIGLLAATAGVAAHGPDPVLPGGSRWNQDQALSFAWRSGSVPATGYQAAIQAAADDASSTRGSRAATFAYAAGASNLIGYGLGATCGPNGIACFSRNAADQLLDVDARAGPPLRLGIAPLVPGLHDLAGWLLRRREHHARRVRARRDPRPPRQLRQTSPTTPTPSSRPSPARSRTPAGTPTVLGAATSRPCRCSTTWTAGARSTRPASTSRRPSCSRRVRRP